MSEVKWIKMSVNLFDNRKIKQIRKMPDGDAIIGIWLQILCVAGMLNDSGFVYFTKDIPYTDEMLATEFDRPISTIRLALNTFMHFKMVEIVDNFMMVSNWEKYQNVDGLEKIREQTKKRVATYRNKQKSLSESTECNVTVTQCNATDKNRKDKDKDKDKEKVYVRKRFTPPSLEEVQAYCLERKNTVNPQKFIDFYKSKGWKVGKTKMEDWKACVRTWEQRDKKESPSDKDWGLNIERL